MPSQGYQLTPEQLALSEERKRLKLLKKKEKEEQGETATANDPRGKILDRQWLSTHQAASEPSPSLGSSGNVTVKVMTWNVSILAIHVY